MFKKILIIIAGYIFFPSFGYLLLKNVKKSYFALMLFVTTLLGTLFISNVYYLFFVYCIIIAIFLYFIIDVVRYKNIDNKKIKVYHYFTILAITIGTLFIYYSIFSKSVRSFYLPVKSMEKTFYKGDIIGAIKSKNIKRKDIVVYKKDNIFFSKRVVAKDGDEVIYYNKHLLVYFKNIPNIKLESLKSLTINGKKWYLDPYKTEIKSIIYKPNYNGNLYLLMAVRVGKIAMQPIFVDGIESTAYLNKGKKFNAFYYKVPKDSFFMLGDNRDNSTDSRFYGSIRKENIYGKVEIVYFNFKMFNRFMKKVK